MLRAAWFLIAGLFTRRSRPSPFFDAHGAIVVQPAIISDDAS
jgi:hypothetical protein